MGREVHPLADARSRQGLSRKELARRVGCHETTIWRLERRLAGPSVQLATVLAEVVGEQRDALFGPATPCECGCGQPCLGRIVKGHNMGKGHAIQSGLGVEERQALLAYKAEHGLVDLHELAKLAKCSHKTVWNYKEHLESAHRYNGRWSRDPRSRPWLFSRDETARLKQLLADTAAARPRRPVRQCKTCGRQLGGQNDVYCNHECESKDPAVRDRRRREAAERVARWHEPLRERKGNDAGLLSAAEVADWLVVSRSSVTQTYVGKHGLRAERVPVRFAGGGGVLLFTRNDVRQFVRQWVRRSDGYALRMFNEETYCTDRRVETLARIKGLAPAEAKLVLQARVALRRSRWLPHRRGRKSSPGPPAHHLEWATLYAQLYSTMLEDFRERQSAGLELEGDREPIHFDVCLAVAEADFAAHRDRWADYPHAPSDASALHPSFARTAANRVAQATAVKEVARTLASRKDLQNAHSRIPAR